MVRHRSDAGLTRYLPSLALAEVRAVCPDAAPLLADLLTHPSVIVGELDTATADQVDQLRLVEVIVPTVASARPILAWYWSKYWVISGRAAPGRTAAHGECGMHSAQADPTLFNAAFGWQVKHWSQCFSCSLQVTEGQPCRSHIDAGQRLTSVGPGRSSLNLPAYLAYHAQGGR